MVAGWLVRRPEAEISPLTDIAFPLGIGLVTYLGGRLNGAVWLSVPLARLVLQRFDTDAVVSSVECVLVYAFTSMVITRELRAGITRHQLQALIASTADVVLILDEDGHYRQVAQTGGLVRPADELVGRNLSDIF